jgi:hypothetical protein
MQQSSKKQKKKRKKRNHKEFTLVRFRKKSKRYLGEVVDFQADA